jgi:citrate synthase
MVLYSRDKRADDLALENQIRQGLELVAKLVPLVPWAYYSIDYGFRDRSLIIHMPDSTHTAAETFLRLLRPNMEFTALEARVLDVALVLHAEHGGGNNSTFTMRVVSSTGTDFYAAATAAVGSLKGPLHGGANVQVVKMFEEVKRDVKNWHSRDEVRAWIVQLLKKEKFDRTGVLYGFGHAVYTISDPRAVILKRYARKLAIEKGRQDELELYELFEEEAPRVLKEMGKGSKEALCANVDFYSGFIYDCLGIPTEVFTPLFAMARMAGWAAHRIEMLTGPLKIVRPAFKYIGEIDVPYTPVNERKCPDAADSASVLAR